MNHSLPDPLLSQLSADIAAQLGLHFPGERWRDLERGMRSAAREFGFHDVESCAQWMVSSRLTRNQTEILASSLTVGETYFFRERKSFAVLEEHILPELLRSRRGTDRRLRIWSAGCCTGEEPYSIAILLSKMIPDLREWNITLLATDMNPRFLQKASAGVYSEWSFRDTPHSLKERYFTRTQDGRFAILPQIQKMVACSSLNLAEDSYPSLLNNTNAMDVIFCRNVLMYFAPEQVKRVIFNLYRALVDGGWLIVSPSEASHVLFSQFVTVNFPDAIFYRKVVSPKLGVADFEFPASARNERERQVSSQDAKLETFNPQLETFNSGPQKPTPYQEAVALYEQGRFVEAAEQVGVWLSQNEVDAKALALSARVCANQGKLTEALAWCDKALSADKLDTGLHYLRAMILQEQGELNEAKGALKRALYLDPDFALAHFALGSLARRQGKLRESQKHFDNALALLRACPQEEIVPESEGMTAGRLMEVIASTSRVNGEEV